MTRRPHASAQLPDLPAQEAAKLGSLREETTGKGEGAEGLGW